MKIYRYFTLIVLCTFLLKSFAQSTNQNYIKTTVYKEPFTEQNLPPTPTLQQAAVQVSYFDGLGRPLQNVAVGQSHTGKDIVTPFAYDAFGRQTKDYLPYATGTTTGQYYDQALTDVMIYYYKPTYANTTHPYSEKLLENSPLDRILKQAAPGNDWALGTGHEIKFGYDTNVANEVRLFQVTTTWVENVGMDTISLQPGVNYYQPAQLYKNTTIDENTTTTTSNRTEEFKDKEGRVVLKRVWARVGGFDSAQPPTSVETHDTYYIYDIYGNLTYVLPPAVDTAGAITTDMLNGLCYQYKYDHRNRMVAKKLPGKTWEYIVYDALDRVRATGPVASPFTNTTGSGWLFTKYDTFNRPVLTAWQAATVNETTRKTLHDAIASNTNLSEQKAAANVTFNTIVHRYTNVSTPTTGYHILTVTYYDDYNFPNAPTTFTDVLGQPVRNASNGNCKGLVTGSWVRLLENIGYPRANLTTTLYKNDRNATPISTKTLYHNNGNGYTQVNSEVNFQGQVTHTETRHKRLSGSTELVVNEYFTYTPQGRLLTHTHQVNNNAVETLADNDYDALGQLLTKKVGRQAINPLQTINYTYNLRGWLTDINNVNTLGDDLFAFGIRYNTDVQPGTTPLYNGNIAETLWQTESTLQKKLYQYTYDGLNRLRNAQYKNTATNILNTYNESLSYDKNGNILSLQRTGGQESPTIATPIDNLTYLYDTVNKNNNKLLSVTDATNCDSGFNDGNTAGNDYDYDVYGNMTKDLNKAITNIKYNHLNLPTEINFATGNKITYLYTATGEKMQKLVVSGNTTSTTNYWNGFQYNNNILIHFPTAEGYVKVSSLNGNTLYSYVYHYKDHLGNIRLSYSLDTNTGNLATLEEHHYYPFGLEHVTQIEWNIVPIQGPQGIKPTFTQVANNGYQYQYNGKEWQDELGLNMTAMDFRQYDNALGRFVGMDRLSELAYSITPYRYAYNNPVYWNDAFGLFETRKEAREYKKNNDIKGSIKKNNDGTYTIYGKNNIIYTAGNDVQSNDAVTIDSNKNDGVIEELYIENKKSAKDPIPNPGYWGYSKSNSDNIGSLRSGYADYYEDAPVTTTGGGGGAVVETFSVLGFIQWIVGLFVTTQSGADAIIKAKSHEKTYEHNETTMEKSNEESVVNEPAIKVELLKLNIVDVNYKGEVMDANYQNYDSLVNTSVDSLNAVNQNKLKNNKKRIDALKKWKSNR